MNRENDLAAAEQFDALRPLDEHNRQLQANVRPANWKNPQPPGRYNLVVLGAGTAGLVTAAGAAGMGARVALVERSLLGGDCLNVGCVPSKGLLSAARVAAAARRAADFGVRVDGDVTVSFGDTMERMRRLRAAISPNDSAARFRDLGVDVYFGSGQFRSSSEIEVDGTVLKFKKAVIATGARAAAPPIEGLEGVSYLTNETVFSLTELPGRLGIVGAGPIGCELAQAFARFGSRVFLVETAHGVLPSEDPRASAIVERALLDDGVQLLCCGRELAVHEDAQIHLAVTSHDRAYDEQVDQLLVAAGRAPNVEGLGLEKIGVEFDKQGVRVDDRLQTTNPVVYAAGDVCSKYKFTHAADFMARIVIQNALFLGRKKVSALTIPWCTYTSPEVAHVGLSAEQAEEEGIEFDCYRQPFAENDRAILEGETKGFVQVLTKQGSGTILGATIVARNAGDLISEITLAITHGLGLSQLAATIHPYPTQAEAIRKLGDQYNRTRLTPFVKKLVEKWLAWNR